MTDRPPRGFALIELLAALAVAATLLSLAAGPFGRLLQARAVGAQAGELVEALRLAASEARKRGEPVTVCALAGQADAPRCAASAASGWQDGWLVFVDRGLRASVDAGDTILRIETRLARSGGVAGTLRALTYAASGISMDSASHFLFRPVGLSPGPAQDALSILVCVAKPGRPRVLPLGVVECAD